MDSSRRFLRGESSRATFDRRVRRRTRRDVGLIDLPTEILHSIMLHVSRSFRDYVVARASIRTLRMVTSDEVFVREVDLFTMQFPYQIYDGIMEFKMLCHHLGNLSALFLQGCSEFFRHNNLEFGMTIIREAAVRGYELAIYAYSNLRRILSPEIDVDLALLNPNRDLVRRMRSRVEANRVRYWGPNVALPELFVQRVAAFEYGIIYKCRCASIDRWNYYWG
ncbi:unnamed protein product [Cochlearia groenlandica]